MCEYNKICEQCGKEFTTKNRRKRFCKGLCSERKWRTNNPELYASELRKKRDAFKTNLNYISHAQFGQIHEYIGKAYWREQGYDIAQMEECGAFDIVAFDFVNNKFFRIDITKGTQQVSGEGVRTRTHKRRKILNNCIDIITNVELTKLSDCEYKFKVTNIRKEDLE